MHKIKLDFCWHLFLIVLISTIIYANVFNNSFVWDDQLLIVRNPFIKNPNNLPVIFTHDLYCGTQESSNYYRPIQALSYMLDYSIWKLNPWGYHLTNLLIHILNAILIYLLFNLIIKNKIIPFWASLLFAVHPIHTETVTYIAGRADSLVTLFFLASVFFFVKYAEHIQVQKKILYYMGSIICFALALLSKDIAIMLPFVILLYDCVFVKKEKKINRWLSFFIMAGAYGILRLTVLNFSNIVIDGKLNLWVRFITMFKVIAGYLRLLLLPVGLHMERGIKPVTTIFDLSIIFSDIFILILIWLLIKSYKYSKIIFFGGMWFFINFIPVSNIFPLLTNMAEHWLYLPSIGLFMVLSTGIIKLSEIRVEKIPSSNLKKFVIFLFILVIACYSVLTIKQNTIWKDEITLFNYILKYVPDNIKVRYSLGMAYANKKLYNEALFQIQKVIQLNPQFALAYNGLGTIYDKSGNFEKAMSSYKEAIRLKPTIEEAHNNLGSLYDRKRNHEEAIREYREAIKLNPYYALAHYNLGYSYHKKGMLNEAMDEYRKAIDISPEHAKAHGNLGLCYEMKNMFMEAIQEYNKSIQIDSQNINNYINLAICYSRADMNDNAFVTFRKAIDLNPNSIEMHYNFGIFLYKQGKIDEAKGEWELVKKLAPNDKVLRRKIDALLKSDK